MSNKNNCEYLKSLKAGDVISVQTPTGVIQEKIRRISHNHTGPRSTIYTEEGGWYWLSNGESRLIPHISDYIIIPPEYQNEIPS